MDCFHHPGRSAVKHCRQCQRPVCAECLVVEEGKPFCSEECARRFRAFSERYGAVAPRRPSLLYRLVLLATAVLIGLIALRIGHSRGVPFFVRLHAFLFGW